MNEPVTPFISLHTASSLTGVSVRTLWRRIASAEIESRKESGPSARTLVALQDLLPFSPMPIVSEDMQMVCAADSGDPDAQCDLGIAFLLAGRATEAVKWFSVSAERFCADALYQLARCHLVGIGVTRDETTGMQLMVRSSERGHAVAEHLIKYLQDPARPPLSAEALESEMDSLERHIVLRVLRESAKSP